MNHDHQNVYSVPPEIDEVAAVVNLLPQYIGKIGLTRLKAMLLGVKCAYLK